MASFDAKLEKSVDQDLFKEVDEIQAKERRRIYARAGARTAGGAVAGGLTAWAVANFWNPSGWLAALAAGGVALVGYAGERAANAATESWKEATRRDLQKERSRIIASLRDRLWDHHRAQNSRCFEWLDKSLATFGAELSSTLQVVETQCEEIRRGTVQLLGEMDRIEQRLHADLIAQCIPLLSQDAERHSPLVDRVAREVGVGTKVLLSPQVDGRTPRAQWIRDIAPALRHLVGEPVTLVDGGGSIQEQIAQALRPARISATSITVGKDANRTAEVTPPPGEVGRAIGARGSNVRLAGRLLDLSIVVVGDKRREHAQR
jgi:transcription antitermination factor NusA-like protein